MMNTCPICQYRHLQQPPYDQNGNGSYEICPGCGFQFGHDDFPDKQSAITKWREQWVQAGCPWFSPSTPKPADWEPLK